MGLQVLLDLVERFFGAKMRLVVQSLDLLLSILDTLLLLDLVADEVNVGHVHLDTVGGSEGVLAVHVVHHRIELFLLRLTTLLNVDVPLVETVEGLLVDSTNCFIGAAALVCSMIVDGKGALRAEELGHGGVVLVRDLLAVEGRLHISHILHDARGGNFRGCLGDGVRVDDQTLVRAVFVHLLRSRVELFVLRELLLRHVNLGQTE